MSEKHIKTEECMDISLECSDEISMDNFTLKTPTRRTTKKLSPKKRTAKTQLLTKLSTKKLSNREKRPRSGTTK